MKSVLRLASLITAVVVVASACGQKPGVHTSTGGGQFVEEGTITAEGPLEEVTGEGEAVTEGPATAGETTTGGGTTRGTTTGTGGGASGPADRTGITDSQITIGIHAPVTGAAPFPASAFERGRELYWTWSGAPKVQGRTLKVVFEDDQYNPFTAVDRCRKMAEQDKAFLLVGAGGTDQIQACARWAASKGIPYLSAGVTEVGMRNLRNYFAISMSYAQQGPLLAQMIQKEARLASATKVAMVRTNTPNFQDAHDTFVQAFQQTGRQLVLDRTMSKNPSATEYDDTARALATSGAEVVYLLIAPTHYVQLTASSRLPPTYRPWWVSVGVVLGLNDVLGTGCPTSNNAIGKALHFSPFTGIDKTNELDANYNRAYREKHGTDGDDLGWALWGLFKSLHLILDNSGRDLSRQSFIAKTEQSSFESGLFPAVKYTPQNHFGADAVHLLQANCSTRRHETSAMFVKGF